MMPSGSHRTEPSPDLVLAAGLKLLVALLAVKLVKRTAALFILVGALAASSVGRLSGAGRRIAPAAGAATGSK